MQKRRVLDCERLERRELPAGAIGARVLPLDLTAGIAVAQDYLHPSPMGVFAQPGQAAALSRPTDAPSSEAVGLFFADFTEAGFFHPASAPGVGELARGAELLPDGTAGQDPSGEADFASFTATTLEGMPSVHKAVPDVSEAEFWAFLRNYATKAIRRDERARGPLADHADIIQQIYVEWREEVSSVSDVHSRLLDQNSTERLVFRTAVRRVLDRTRYGDERQRRLERTTEHEAEDRPAARDWADLEIDLAQGVGSLSPRDRAVLDLRRQGLTFEEIGARLGMTRQRAYEAFSGCIERLTALYRD
jgi:RNA polymerase sigma factor (sigma-70 family)